MALSEAAKAARREYMRQYRLINGERMRAQEKARYEKNKEAYKARIEKYWENKALNTIDGK